MAHRIVAEFDTLESTVAAEAHLRAEGFSFARSKIESERAGLQPDSGSDAVRRQPEEWSIVCHAPFGRALRATELLKSCGAVTLREVQEVPARRVGTAESRMDADDMPARSSLRSPDESFFVSSLFGLPLLIDCPAPLSSLLGLPTLLRD
ncbi:MAG: hypothetical protein U1E16_09780 [Hyphomicrobiales bacterium]